MGTGKRVTFDVADDDNVAIDSLIGNPKITLTKSDENAGKIGNQLFSDRKSRRSKKSFRGTYLHIIDKVCKTPKFFEAGPDPKIGSGE